jgi:hypothetical protein
MERKEGRGNICSNLEREKDKGNEIFSHPKHINIPFREITKMPFPQAY